MEQYVAAAVHIRWYVKASMASNGKHHHGFLHGVFYLGSYMLDNSDRVNTMTILKAYWR